MNYPLAHDENGFPLEVPATAVAWLPRRHSGGKGRPGNVYGADGRPVTVPLHATADDLRAAGCRPGPYRLDAIDDRGRPIGVVAYTELTGAEDGDEAGARPAADPAVMALARAVEAMQRVQAERERVQAEMFAKLIERIAPAPSHPGQDLRNALGQAADLKKTLDGLAAAHLEENDDEDDDDAEQTVPAAQVANIERLIERISPLVDQITSAVKGVAMAMQAKAALRNAAPAAGPTAAPEEARAAAKVDAVLSQLTPEEFEVAARMWKALPAEMRKVIEQQIVTLEAGEALGKVRALLEQYGPNFAKPAAA